MREGPNQGNRSLRCEYHRDHGHETNHCHSLKFLVEKLIRAGHLKWYLREPTRGPTAAPTVDRAVADIEHASRPRPTINFILGGCRQTISIQETIDKNAPSGIGQSQSKHSQRPGDITAVLQVDGPISFPPINPTRVITPHYDALVLTVCINSFDVYRVLVDPGSAADLLHLPALRHMGVPMDHLYSAGRVLSGFNGAITLSVGDITFSVKVGPVS